MENVLWTWKCFQWKAKGTKDKQYFLLHRKNLMKRIIKQCSTMIKNIIYLGIHWNRFGILRVAGHTESWIRWINHIAMSRGHVISHLYKTSRLVRNASGWPKFWSFKTTFRTSRFSENLRILFSINCLILKIETNFLPMGHSMTTWTKSCPFSTTTYVPLHGHF